MAQHGTAMFGSPGCIRLTFVLHTSIVHGTVLHSEMFVRGLDSFGTMKVRTHRSECGLPLNASELCCRLRTAKHRCCSSFFFFSVSFFFIAYEIARSMAERCPVFATMAKPTWRPLRSWRGTSSLGWGRAFLRHWCVWLDGWGS